MLNRRDMLNSVLGLPICSLVKEENNKIPTDEVRAKAELWDLFMKVTQTVSDNITRVGQKCDIVNVGKTINENEYWVSVNDSFLKSKNLEEVYIFGLRERLKELSIECKV